VRVRAPAEADALPRGALAEAIRDLRWPRVSQKSPDYLLVAAQILDRLEAAEGKVSDAARSLGISTASLVKFLALDVDLWQEANRLRVRHGQKPLRSG